MAGRCKLIDLEAVVPDSWLNPTSKIYSFWATFFHRNEAFIVEKKSPYVALKKIGGKGWKAASSQLPAARWCDVRTKRARACAANSLAWKV